MIRSARSSNSEELHHADETVELQFDAAVSESLQVHEDELNEQLHEHDEDYELTAEGILKCLIRDLSDHEPELSTEELFEVDRQACLFEVARLESKSVLVQVEGLASKGFAFLDPHREGLFSPASSSIVTRLIPTLFMQQRASGWSMIAVDVADAYLTCSQGSPTVTSVKLGHQTLWFRLDKCLPGQRDGSSRWFGDFSSYLNERCHTEQMPQMTSILRFPAKQGAGLLHVDDLLAAGVTSVLEDCCAQLCKKYTISVQWIRGVNDQLMFLKKRHILISDGELCIQVHGKHLERLLDLTGLSKAKVRARQSPMPTGTLPTETNDDPELPPAEASVFRSCVGILLYLQADIPEAQFCMRYLASYMSKPTKGSWAILRHLTGYLHQHKGQCQCISSSEPGQGMIVQEDGKHVVEAYSDADWAGCKVTCKSVSGSAFLVNGQLVYSASRSQRLIALSSAESEYHAAIICAIDGLLIHAVVEFLFEGAVAPLRVLVDNAAARSMMLRQGVGRVRHIHARLLWIQQRVQLGEIIVSPVPTAAQARAVQVCRVHRQVRAAVATADQDIIRMLQAFLIAMQATRALSADDGQDDGSDEPPPLDGILATMMQVFGYIAAFVEAYPAAVSAAAQVVAICIILCLASCVFRRDNHQPTVNVHIGGGQLEVSVNDGRFTKTLTPVAGGAPGTPQMPMSCSSSGDEASFDPEQWITDAAREAKMQRQAQSRGASSKAKSSPRHDETDHERRDMPGSSNDKPDRQLPKAPRRCRERQPVQEVWVASNQGRRYHRLGCGKLHGANNVVSMSRADAEHQLYTPCSVCKP
eukprot:s1721_g11.t1